MTISHQTSPSGGNILLVGCGNMGAALLDRWKQSATSSHFDVIDPHHTQKNESNVTWHKNLASLSPAYVPAVIVLAVKPQQLNSILSEYGARFSGGNPLYLSIAAGKTLAFYTSHLGEHAHVVRVMPNTPALVGEGMSVLCSAATLPASARKIASDLMKAVGKVEWLEDETLMNAVTAISGCGPAYVFLFLESLTEAGIKLGLPEPLAKTLALQTVSGSLTLAEQSPKSFEQLRINVASPGGATEAALAILLKDDGFKKIMDSAAGAAEKRSRELI